YGGNLTFVIPNLILFGLIISVITIIMNVLLKDYMIARIALFNAIAMYIAYFQMNLTMNMDGFTEFFLILVLVYNTNKMIKLHSLTYPFFTWTMINHIIASTPVLLLMSNNPLKFNSQNSRVCFYSISFSICQKYVDACSFHLHYRQKTFQVQIHCNQSHPENIRYHRICHELPYGINNQHHLQTF